MRLKSTLKVCLSIFRIRLAESLQYRLAALSGAAIGFFWGLIEAVVLTVFYTYAANRAGSFNGLTLAGAVSYTWIAQCIVPLIAMGIDGSLLSQINSGDVGIELCRPLGLYEHWYAKTAAGRLGGFLSRSILLAIAALLMPESLRLSAPASLEGFLMFLLSLGAAFFLSTAFCMLATALRLGITWGEGPTHMLLLLGSVLSGAYLPLQLWPDALQRILILQPFAGYLDIPARLYVGSMPPVEGFGAVGLQILWTAVFILAGKAVMRHKLQNLIIQGG